MNQTKPMTGLALILALFVPMLAACGGGGGGGGKVGRVIDCATAGGKIAMAVCVYNNLLAKQTQPRGKATSRPVVPTWEGKLTGHKIEVYTQIRIGTNAWAKWARIEQEVAADFHDYCQTHDQDGIYTFYKLPVDVWHRGRKLDELSCGWQTEVQSEKAANFTGRVRITINGPTGGNTIVQFYDVVDGYGAEVVFPDLFFSLLPHWETGHRWSAPGEPFKWISGSSSFFTGGFLLPPVPEFEIAGISGEFEAYRVESQ